MTVGRLPVIEIATPRDVQSLASEWDGLLAVSCTRSPFLTWAWVSSWLDTVGAMADLVVHTARDADTGRLLGIAPFQVVNSRRGGLRLAELRMIGTGVAAPDHLDLIVDPDAGARIADALWESVHRAQRWDVIDLDGIKEAGHLDRLVLRRERDKPERMAVPYLPLSDDWEAVRSRFGRSHRQNIGRYGRKLDSEAGDTVTERLVTDPADLDLTFDALIRMHQTIRTSKGDPGLFADEETIRFLRTAAHRLLRAGRLRMWRLDVGSDPIAVIWCMRAFDSVAFYTTGFDPNWSQYGPGRRIMARAIEAAAAEGATEFDFLRGDEAYKSAWGTEVREQLRVRRPASARGRVFWTLRSTVGLLRRGRSTGA